jgi:hypothetical protein
MPADLQQLAGDVPADGIRMRCDTCGKREWMRVSFENVPAAERQRVRVRRLAEVRMVRKVIWRDERALRSSPAVSEGRNASMALTGRFTDPGTCGGGFGAGQQI